MDMGIPRRHRQRNPTGLLYPPVLPRLPLDILSSLSSHFLFNLP